MSPSSTIWKAILQLQERVQGDHHISPHSLAREQALSEAVERLATTKELTAEQVLRQARNRAINFKGTLVQRSVLLEQFAHNDSHQELLEEQAIHERLEVRLSQALEVQDQQLLRQLEDGYTFAELAEQSGVPVGTLKSRASRARASLRVLLDELLEEPTPRRHLPRCA